MWTRESRAELGSVQALKWAAGRGQRWQARGAPTSSWRRGPAIASSMGTAWCRPGLTWDRDLAAPRRQFAGAPDSRSAIHLPTCRPATRRRRSAGDPHRRRPARWSCGGRGRGVGHRQGSIGGPAGGDARSGPAGPTRPHVVDSRPATPPNGDLTTQVTNQKPARIPQNPTRKHPLSFYISNQIIDGMMYVVSLSPVLLSVCVRG